MSSSSNYILVRVSDTLVKVLGLSHTHTYIHTPRRTNTKCFQTREEKAGRRLRGWGVGWRDWMSERVGHTLDPCPKPSRCCDHPLPSIHSLHHSSTSSTNKLTQFICRLQRVNMARWPAVQCSFLKKKSNWPANSNHAESVTTSAAMKELTCRRTEWGKRLVIEMPRTQKRRFLFA